MFEPKLLVEGKVATRKKPVNFASSDQQIFESSFECYNGPVYLHHFYDVILSNSESKGVLIKNHKVLVESLVHPDHLPSYGIKYIISILLKKKILLEPDSYLLAYDFWSTGYFHWLMDVIPRLYIMRDRLKGYTLLIPEEFKKEEFFLSSLSPFKIGKIYFLKSGKYYRTPSVTVPSHTSITGEYNDELVNKLRWFYLDYFKPRESSSFGERIYVTRKNAKKRKIINEEEVINLLRKFEFEVVDFEEYNFVDQISIASNANVIVSIHGAGLTNIFFMPSDGYVLELIHKEMKVLCYYFLADALKLNYLYQKCEPVQSQKSFFTADIIVDLELLEKNLKIMFNHEHEMS